MDSQLRRAERIYKERGGHENHARWLILVVKNNPIDVNRLKLAAFLKHPVAIDVGRNFGWAKPSGVIYNDVLVKNIENKQICCGLRDWGNKLINLATLGVVEFLEEKYVFSRTLEFYPNYRRSVERRHNILNLRRSYNALREETRVTRNLFIVSTYLDDKDFLFALQKHTIPWALGDFQ